MNRISLSFNPLIIFISSSWKDSYIKNEIEVAREIISSLYLKPNTGDAGSPDTSKTHSVQRVRESKIKDIQSEAIQRLFEKDKIKYYFKYQLLENKGVSLDLLAIDELARKGKLKYTLDLKQDYYGIPMRISDILALLEAEDQFIP